MIEINFCFDDRVEMIKGVVVPSVGSTIQIAKQDYIVKSVFWSLDYVNDNHIQTSLRATVECEVCC